MEVTATQRLFVEEVLHEKYGDEESLELLSQNVTSKGLSYHTSGGRLNVRVPEFARALLDTCRRMAAWNLEVLTLLDDDFDMRQRFRENFAAIEMPLASKLLLPGFLVSIVCEISAVGPARKLQDIIKNAGLQLDARVLTIGTTTDEERPVLDEALLDDLQESDLVIECRCSRRETGALSAFSALMAVALIKDYYIAYLEGYRGAIPNVIPAIDLRTGMDGAADAIKGAFSHLMLPASAPPKDPPEKQRPAWQQTLAESIVSNGLVVCVGADLPERRSGSLPSQGELATQLLVEAGLLESSSTPEVLRREPLVPAIWAGFLNRFILTNGSKEAIAEWKKRLATRLRNGVGLVPSLQTLADLLRTVQSNPPEGGPRTMIVTTNVDLAIEYAFIEAGLAFESQVLQPPTREGVPQPSYSAVFSEKKEVNGIVSVSSVNERPVDKLTPQEREQWAADYEKDVPAGGASFDEYIARRHRNFLIGQIYLKSETAARSINVKDQMATGSTLPLLVKLNGSCHRTGDFIAAADEGQQRATELDTQLRNGVMNSAMILIGYGLADHVLMNLHTNVLREPFRTATKARRYALVDPRIGPPSGDSPHNQGAIASLDERLRHQGSYLGFEVVRTDLEPGLRALAESYENAIRIAAAY